VIVDSQSRETESSENLLDPHLGERISKDEIKEILKKMFNEKVEGPDQIPVKVWKHLGEEGLKWLAELFNVILRILKMPREWRFSTVIPLYKNKGDIQDCNNYSDIKLLSHTMKLWEMVIKRMLRKDIKISDNQFGFISGISTTEASYLLRRLMGLYRYRKVDLYMVFIDLEKNI